MAWRRPGDKPLSEPMLVGLMSKSQTAELETGITISHLYMTGDKASGLGS